MLADDIFTKYFPNAASKNVMVDASLLIKDDWYNVLTDVWHTPTEISDTITTDNYINEYGKKMRLEMKATL